MRNPSHIHSVISGADLSTSVPCEVLPLQDNDDDPLSSKKHTRKKAIHSNAPPAINTLEYSAFHTRRRKKSSKSVDDLENGEAPEHSPIKEYFSSNSFQAGMEKLGNFARRFSRDNPISNLTSSHDASRSSGATSRKTSSLTETNHPASSTLEVGTSSRKTSLITSAISSRSSKEEEGSISRKTSLTTQAHHSRSSKEEEDVASRKSSSILLPTPPPSHSRESGSTSRRSYAIQQVGSSASSGVFVLNHPPRSL